MALKSNPETATIPLIIVAGRGSDFDEGEKRADFAIYKDIDIEAQLEKALDAVWKKDSRRQTAGKETSRYQSGMSQRSAKPASAEKSIGAKSLARNFG